MTRIAIFSHACVIPVNRELFLELKGKYELLLVAPNSWKGSLIKELNTEDANYLKTYPVLGSGNGSLFFYKSRLQEVKDFKPQIIFLDEEPWSLVALQVYLTFPGVKKVFYTKQNLKKPLPFPFSLIQKHVFKFSSGAFVISEEAKDVLRWKSFTGPVMRLPHSLNHERFKELNAEEKKNVREQFFLPQNAFLCGYFGRLTEEKGIQDLLDCAEKLISHSNYPQLGFVFVGNGPLLEKIQTMAQRFPQKLFVHTAVPHHHVHTLIGGMDVTLLPSRTTKKWKEQFGRVIIESAACGVPVIGSDSGEIPSLISATGCGLVFPEGKIAPMADAILRLYKDRKYHREISSRAEMNVKKAYSHEAVALELGEQLARFAAIQLTLK